MCSVLITYKRKNILSPIWVLIDKLFNIKIDRLVWYKLDLLKWGQCEIDDVSISFLYYSEQISVLRIRIGRLPEIYLHTFYGYLWVKIAFY